jgi:hypothetical protein
MKKYLLNLVILLVFVSVSRVTLATTYYVNPSTPDIKSIIGDALSGDIIEFETGLYSQLGLVGVPSGVTLRSTDIEDWSIIRTTVIENAAIVTSGTLDIHGLTFTGAAAEYPNYTIHGMGCNLDVENCNFIGTAPSTIHVFSDSQADIKRSQFRFDGTQKITASNSDVNIDNCLFDYYTRIAMDVWPPDAGTYYLDVVRCTFQFNDPDYVISVSGDCRARVRNSIFDHLGTRTVLTSVGADAFIMNCCLPYRVEDYSSAYVDMIDNIHLDPLLVSSPEPYENYKLQDGSPCIDASVYVSIKDAGIEDWLDIDFNSRVNNYNADIGAWEHPGARQPRTWYVDCQSTYPLPDGTNWAKAFPTIQEALNVCGVGDIIMVAPGQYNENLDLDAPKHNKLTLQSSTLQPYTTIIQSSETNRIIDVHGLEYVSIKGFTFTGSTGGAVAFRECGAGCKIMNCVITDNSASGPASIYQLGGGIYCEDSTLEVINCLIKQNAALGNGGAAYKAGTGIMNLKNCTIYGNASGIYNDGYTSNLKAYNTLFWNNGMNDYSNSYAYDCWSEQESDPDPQFIKAPDVLWLAEGSGCIDAGDNYNYPGGSSNPDPSTDLSGNERFFDGDEDDTITIDIGAYEYQPVFPRIYVDADSDDYDGSSWLTPFKYLQDALEAARESEGYVKEIWVADGSYYPDIRKENLPPGTGVREESFHLIDGLKMYGGFQGVSAEFPHGESSIQERSEDKSQYPSVLNGDIDDDAQERDFSTRSSDRGKPPGSGGIDEIGDSYNVVTALNIDSGGLDRFTVQNGNADGTLANSNGAGAVVINSTFKIIDCTFAYNVAAGRGGGMYLVLSDPNLLGCTFIENKSDFGAAIFNYLSSPSIQECVFISNDATAGGAIFNHTSCSPLIESCIFQDNSASGGTASGGAIANETDCSTKIVNSVFAENTAMDGGALLGWYLCDLSVINCTCAYNEAGTEGHGGGLYMNSSYSTASIYNSIFWNNSVGDELTLDAQISPQYNADIQYCCVNEIETTNNNINDGPRFQNPKPQANIIGPSHDGDESFYLNADSPCIDWGLNDFVPEYLYKDIAGYKRIQNEIVDLGAYEIGNEEPDDVIVVLCWIDESCGQVTSYHDNVSGGEQLYADDVAEFEATVDRQLWPVMAKCFDLPSSYGQHIIPDGALPPDDIIIGDFPRTPTLLDFTNDFKDLVSDANPLYILLAVDNSGSMEESTIEPEYDEFRDWLAFRYPRAVINPDDDDCISPTEQWIKSMNDFIVEYVEGKSVRGYGTSSWPGDGY